MASKLVQVIDKIHHSIQQTQQPAIIYMGIGAACGLFNENGLIDDKNYHEYPMFLQKMQEQLYSTKIDIILIDPLLTNPPYIVKDHSKHLDFKQTEPDTYVAKSATQNIVTVHCIREYVCIDGQYSCDECFNITQALFHLNEICMHESVLFVFNDFSGRSNKYVAEFFDDQISKHLDHIIIGLGARKDSGCYIDVTGSDCVFPFKLTERNRMMVKVFNIYNYLFGNDNYDINLAVAEYYGDENIDKITSQIHIAIEQYINDFKGKSMGILKSVHKLWKQNDITQSEYIIETIDYKHRETVTMLIKDRSYAKLYDFMFSLIARDLDVILKLRQAGGTGKELLAIITRDSDPNQWYNELRIIY